MPRHPPLSQEEKKRYFEEGLKLFNRHKFYECHEALEHIWLAETGADRLFYQGLIQLASSRHHLQKGKKYPAKACLKKGIEKLKNYPCPYFGLDWKKWC